MNKTKAKYFLGIVFIFTVLFGYFAREVRLDYSYEGFFSKSDHSVQTYENFKSAFDGENDFILVSIKAPNSIYDQKFLQDIKSIGDELKTVPFINSVTSPVHNCYYVKQSGFSGLEKIPCLNLKNPELPDSTKINGKLLNRFISSDGQSVCLYLDRVVDLNKIEGDSLKTAFMGVLENHKYEYYTAGRLFSQIEYVRIIEQELLKFLAIAIVILVVFLAFTYRSWFGVIIPLFIVLISIVWTLGIMGISGKKIDLLMTILPTIIFVIGLSDIIHFFNKYLIEIKTNTAPNAIKIAFKEVGVATLLTSLTTAVGFFTLTVTDIELVRGFGFYSGLSILITFVITFAILPSVLILFPSLFKVRKRKGTLDKWLRNSFLLTIKNRKAIITVSCVMLVFFIWGMTKLNSNNYLLEDLRNDNPIKKEVVFFEDNYNGIRPFELLVKVKKGHGTVFTHKNILEIDKLQNYIHENYANGVKNVGSVVDAIKTVYSIKHNNSEHYYRIPQKEKTYNNTLRQIASIADDEVVKKVGEFISSDTLLTRIRGNVGDLGGAFFRGENEKLSQFYKTNIDTNLISIQITGTPHLVDEAHKNISNTILLGLLGSIAIISLIVLFIFKSWKIMVVSLVPNLLPLIITAGFMGIIGLDLKISTVIIFSLAFGIAVDDTIHMLSKYKIELNNGRHPFYALKRSVLSTGKAVITTSLILCGGFVSLMFSDFLSIKNMGILVGITLATAVIVDLYLLPVLILYFAKKKA